jgi:hypothetical protein
MVFASQDNVQMLWELLLDNLQGTNQQLNIQSLQSTFLNNVKMFNEKERNNITSANLVAANKHFLKNMVGLINRELQIQETRQNQQNLTYLAKDIQAQRQNQFDIQLQQKRQEFDNYNIVKKPPVPNFADNIDLENEKLNAANIKQMIDQTVAQRNYETDNNTNIKSNIFDKINNNISKKPSFKQIKIDNENLSNKIIENSVVDLDNKKKQVTWLDNVEIDQDQDQNEENINFSILEKPFNILNKLKKVNDNDNNIYNNSINNNSINNSINNDTNIKLDEINSKIDDLTNKINLIYNLLNTNNTNNNN